MVETKPWYKSAGILGPLVTVICLALKAGGVADVAPDDQVVLVNALLDVSAAVSAMVGAWGRARARTRIG